MAGLALQLERDFEVGDWISLDDRISGRIREVRWRATTHRHQERRPHADPERGDHPRDHRQLQPADHRAPAVDQRAGPLPAPAGAGARGDRRGGAGAVVRARRSAARLHPARVQGGRLHLLGAATGWTTSSATTSMDSAVRSAIWYALHRAGMEIPFPSRNVNVTEMNEDRVQRKLDEEYARRVDALVARRRVPGARRREDRSAGAPAAPCRVRPGRGDPAPGRSGRFALRRARRERGRADRRARRVQGDRHAGRRAVLRRDVAHDRRIARGDRRREDRRRVLHRRQGGVPGDPARRSRSSPASSATSCRGGRSRSATPRPRPASVPTAVQKNQLLLKIAAFFGIKTARRS